MSTFEKKNNKFIFIPNGELQELDKSIVLAMFDKEVEDDIDRLKHEAGNNKLLRRICLLKTIIYPIELFLSLFLLNRAWTRDRVYCQGLYWAFLRNKMSSEVFQTKMMQSLGGM